MVVSGDGGVGGVDLVVPLKRLDGAKSRLRPASAARGATHRGLVLALARDTLVAVGASARIGRVLVVTGEPDLDLAELVGPDATRAGGPSFATLADPGGGLNPALRAGAAHLRSGRRTGPDPGAASRPVAVAALQADLPALTAAELDDALDAALAHVRRAGSRAYVADHQGTGTTLLVAAAGTALRPRFGPGSAAAHRADGAVGLDGAWPGLRADVDTPADLERVRALGCGPATRAWPHDVERHGVAPCTATAR